MPAHPIESILRKHTKQVIGLMSGTSADGLDCALCTVTGHGEDTRIDSVAARTYPYSPEERARILALFDRGATVRAVCEGSFWLGEIFARGALRLLAELGVSPRSVDLIGSHGQTLWHQPPSAGRGDPAAVPSTLQIGEPAVIAARTGLLTVGDFRVADVALGGEGAPLVPLCDWLLFRRPGKVRALQNIGGIANVTVLPSRRQDVLAFDNGPGNMMIDALAELCTGGALGFDRDGELSAQGEVQPDLLAELLDDPYLRLPPPKSTGRERYGRNATLAFAGRHPDRRPLDLLRTAVEFTAQAIAQSLAPAALAGRGPLDREAPEAPRFIDREAPEAPRFIDREAPEAPRFIDELLISGGGAHNPTLMGRIAELLAPLPVGRLSEQGVDVDCKEAVAFAVLAVQAVHGVAGNLPGVTGASGPAVLGKLCLPPLVAAP